jgi:hypothetical protein
LNRKIVTKGRSVEMMNNAAKSHAKAIVSPKGLNAWSVNTPSVVVTWATGIKSVHAIRAVTISK